MILLYTLLGLMLLVAMGILALPYFLRIQMSTRGYCSIVAFLSVFSLVCYLFLSHQHNLHLWFSEGKTHYELLEKFEKLGGVDVAIERIKKRLEENPLDAKGWEILGKLYLAKGDKEAAQKAFEKVKVLSSSD